MADVMSITVTIKLVGDEIQFWYGQNQIPGDILAGRGHKIIFKCDRPFAIFIKDFIVSPSPAPDEMPYAFQFATGQSESPFDGLVFASDNSGTIDKTVKSLAKKGSYGFGVAVLGAGKIVTKDPRILID